MIISGGKVIAIDNVLHDESLTGDGTFTPLGVVSAWKDYKGAGIIKISGDIISADVSDYYTKSEVNDISGNITENINSVSSQLTENITNVSSQLTENITNVSSQLTENIDYVSGYINDHEESWLSGKKYTGSGIIYVDNENDYISADMSDYYTIEETDELLDKKQDVLSAGENIEITEDNIVNVSGKSPLITTGPIFAVETSAGIVVGLDEYTTHEYFAGDIGTDKTNTDYSISGNQFSANENIKYLNLALNYSVTLDNPNVDFVYENVFSISSSGMKESYTHYIHGPVSSDSYSVNLNVSNTSPFTITLSSENQQNVKVNLGCIGIKYHYADTYETDFEDSDSDKIIVFNKTYGVLGDEDGNVLSFGDDEQENIELLEV